MVSSAAVNNVTWYKISIHGFMRNGRKKKTVKGLQRENNAFQSRTYITRNCNFAISELCFFFFFAEHLQ